MHEHSSPWISQLNRVRPVDALTANTETNVAIIGAGIAGVTTAYFVLTMTDKTVVLLDADKVAHGATGHNAGQVTSYFEKPFAKLAAQFGLDSAAKGQQAVHDAWHLLERIYEHCKLQTPLLSFTGYAGFSSEEQLAIVLEGLQLQAQAGLRIEHLFLADEAGLSQVFSQYRDLFTLVPKSQVQQLLETKDTRYLGALSARKGCLNSALFCEELVGYLIATYPGRFRLHEHTAVTTVTLHENSASLAAAGNTVRCYTVVLCTNGFERFSIVNEHGPTIDAAFHHHVHGTVGYMAGYVEKSDKPAVAISYLERGGTNENDPYFYLTRRPYDAEENLVCVGGPDIDLPASEQYSSHKHYLPQALTWIDSFLDRSYTTEREPYPAFRWHGLMGYTRTGVRLIGKEPRNPVLLYNLGCNGVGILPSIHGAEKIARLIVGETCEQSIFDPQFG